VKGCVAPISILIILNIDENAAKNQTQAAVMP